MEVLKTAGTEQFTSMRDLGMKWGAGHIMIFSLTSSTTLESLENSLLEQLLKVKDLPGPSIPLVIVGLKTDIKRDNKWCASEVEAQKIADKYGAAFFMLSNKCDPWYRIDECFREVVWRVLWQEENVGAQFTSAKRYRELVLKSFQTANQHMQCSLFWFWYAHKHTAPSTGKKKKSKKLPALLSDDTVFHICRVGMLLGSDFKAPTEQIFEIT